MVTIRRTNPDGSITTIGKSSSTTVPAKQSNAIDYSQDAQKASQQGYNSANYQNGWGIGNYTNPTGGFNSFNDINATRNEINRVNTVMGNRTGYGLDNTQYENYLTKLNSAIAPLTQAEQKATTAEQNWNTTQSQRYNDYMSQFNDYNSQIQSAQDSWRGSQSYAGLNESQNATISSIASKYGFDFSRDVARQQAEAEAQALRDANADAQRRNQSQNELNTARIDANILNAVEGLDASYFQQGLAQQQNQVNAGLNAGIAQDQAMRLLMSRQAEMADVYRDANLGLMEEQQRFTNDDLRLAEALGTINQQALARENSLWTEWQQYLYDVIAQDRDHYLNASNMERQASADSANTLLAMQNALTNNYQFDANLGYNQYRDTVADSQFDRNLFTQQAQNSMANQQWQQNFDQLLREFEYGQQRDQVADQQWNQTFDWGKLMDEAGLTGNYNGNRTLQGQTFDWGKTMDTSSLTGMFNGGKTWERQLQEAQLAIQQAELAMAQRQLNASLSRSYNQPVNPSPSPASNPATQNTVSNLEALYQQYLRDSAKSTNKYMNPVPMSTGKGYTPTY